MNTDSSPRRSATSLLFAALACVFPAISSAATFTVTNNNNSGTGSLRQAMLDSNATPFVPMEGSHSINFSIGSGPKTITLSSALPAITRDVSIDASTQPGFNGVPLIEINGAPAGATANGFMVSNASLVLRGFIINRFGGDGVRIDCPQKEEFRQVRVYGCWIGTNTYGNLAAGNGGHGINIVASHPAIYNEIGAPGANNRNVISGNNADGIHVAPDVQALVFLMNNYIGVGQDGYSNVGNGGDGVVAAPYIYYDYYDSYGMFIGWKTPGSGNVISFNGGNGITIPANANATGYEIPIRRNMIGTDVTGTLDCGNAGHGISVGNWVSCMIGDDGNGNTISGNGFSGIDYHGSSASLSDNCIGTNNIGGKLSNGLHGARFTDVRHVSIRDCTIGNNLLRGVSIEGVTDEWELSGNRIGTNAVGSNLGNGSDGIYIAAFNPANSSYYGSGGYVGPNSEAGLPGNKVAFNGGDGLRIPSPTAICGAMGNEFWSNGGQAIDLGNNGVNPNDAGDVDSGPNELQNFPVISFATPTRVVGTIQSKPNIGYAIGVYAAEPEAGGYGEGKTLLGTAYANTDANGDATWVLAGLSLTPGTQVTALAGASYSIDANGFYWGTKPTTSEFSYNATVASSDTGDFGLSVSTVNVTEGTPTVTLTVNRTGGSSGAVSVAYTISGVTATAGSDYFGTGGTLNFQSGQTSRTITVPITNDTTDEPDETLKVALSNPMGGPQVTGIAETTITIVDNDNPPSISINDVSLAEGNSGATAMGFTVSLSAASAFPITVNWASADGTATGGIDYTSANGSLTFNPGDSQKTITINASGDVITETSETLSVTLSSPTNASLGDSSGTGTILDDDYAGDLQFAAATYSVNEAVEAKSIIVTRAGGAAGTATIHYQISGGTAAVGEDYTAFNTSGTLTFLHGETTKQITLSLLPDDFVEGDETIVMTLSSPTGGAALGTQSSTTLTIVDDDFTASISGRVLLEGGAALQGATVTLGGNANQSVVTDWMGYYSFTGLTLGGNFTVTASCAGKLFTPANHAYPNLNNTMLDQNFTAGEPVDPQLQLTRNPNGTLTLKWKSAATDWTLETSPDMSSGSWTPLQLKATVGDPWTTVTFTPALAKSFYRMVSP
jgi:hypothetical protein